MDVSLHGDRRDPVIPGVAAAAERNIAEIRNTAPELLAPASEISIVEDHHAASAEYLDRRDLVSKISGKPAQPVASPYTKMVAAKAVIRKETSSSCGKRAAIPGGVPVGVVVIAPGIAALCAYQNSG